MQTRTLTLVLQHIGPADMAISFADLAAEALAEYVRDSGGGIFERHITANGCRIDAVRSVDPREGGVGCEFSAGADGIEALRDRVDELTEAAEFLPGGKSADSVVGDAIEYDAPSDVRTRIAEIRGSLPA